MKSEKVTTGKQFIDANGEVSPDFMQDVLLATNDVREREKKKKGVMCHSCHSSYTGATIGNQQIAPFSRHLLAVGLIWGSKCPRFVCVTSPSLPHSLHFLPTRSKIIFSATLGCTDTFGFLPGTRWTPCRRGAAGVCLYVCVGEWETARDVWGKNETAS